MSLVNLKIHVNEANDSFHQSQNGGGPDRKNCDNLKNLVDGKSHPDVDIDDNMLSTDQVILGEMPSFQANSSIQKNLLTFNTNPDTRHHISSVIDDKVGHIFGGNERPSEIKGPILINTGNIEELQQSFNGAQVPMQHQNTAQNSLNGTNSNQIAHNQTSQLATELDEIILQTKDEELKQLMNQQSQELRANLQHHRDLSNLQRMRSNKNNTIGYVLKKNGTQQLSAAQQHLINNSLHQTASLESLMNIQGARQQVYNKSIQEKTPKNAISNANQSLNIQQSLQKVPVASRNYHKRQKSNTQVHIKAQKQGQFNTQASNILNNKNNNTQTTIQTDSKKTKNVFKIDGKLVNQINSINKTMKIKQKSTDLPNINKKKQLQKATSAALRNKNLLGKYKTASGVTTQGLPDRTPKASTNLSLPVHKLLKAQPTKQLNYASHQTHGKTNDHVTNKRLKYSTGGVPSSSSQNEIKRRRITPNNASNAHEMSSNGGGITTNRSIRTQFSKASHRFIKSATPNRSITTTRSVNQLLQNNQDRDLKPSLNSKRRYQTKRFGIDKYETRSMSLASNGRRVKGDHSLQNNRKMLGQRQVSYTYSNRGVDQQPKAQHQHSKTQLINDSNSRLFSSTQMHIQRHSRSKTNQFHKNLPKAVSRHRSTYMRSENKFNSMKTNILPSQRGSGKNRSSLHLYKKLTKKNNKNPLTNRQLKQHIKSSIQQLNTHNPRKSSLKKMISPPLNLSRQNNLEAFKLTEQSLPRKTNIQNPIGQPHLLTSRSKKATLHRNPSTSFISLDPASTSRAQPSTVHRASGSKTARFKKTQNSGEQTIHAQTGQGSSKLGNVANKKGQRTGTQINSQVDKQPKVQKSVKNVKEKVKKKRQSQVNKFQQNQLVQDKYINVEYVHSEAQSQVISINASDANELKNKLTTDCNQEEQQSFALEKVNQLQDNATKSSEKNSTEKQQNSHLLLKNQCAQGDMIEPFSIMSPADTSCPIPKSQEELLSASHIPNNYENFEADQIDEQNNPTPANKVKRASIEITDQNRVLSASTYPMAIYQQHHKSVQDAALQNQKHVLAALDSANRQNPNSSCVKSASTKSTKSSNQILSNNMCNPFCINGKPNYTAKAGPFDSLFNCGFMSDNFQKCMIRTCIPGAAGTANGDYFGGHQRMQNTSFNMLYPNFVENSENSLSNGVGLIQQPLDVGLRGEHHLDTETSESKKQKYYAAQNGQICKSYQNQTKSDKENQNKEFECQEPLSYTRFVQKVSNHKKSRTSDLRKYLNHHTSSTCADYPHKNTQKFQHNLTLQNPNQLQSTAISSNFGANNRLESEINKHTQSFQDQQMSQIQIANPGFIEQTGKDPDNSNGFIQNSKRIDKYNQMLQLIDLKQGNNSNQFQMGTFDARNPFDGSLLQPPSENSQNFYSESPLKKLSNQPLFHKKEAQIRANLDGSLFVKNDQLSPDGEVLKQIVENSSQIKNKFDRQTIINNFFNLQTTEVHLRNSNTDKSKSGVSKVSQPSPYIDVQKVFYNPEFNTNGADCYGAQLPDKNNQIQPDKQQNQTQNNYFVTSPKNINSPTFGQQQMLENPEMNNSDLQNQHLGMSLQLSTQDQNLITQSAGAKDHKNNPPMPMHLSLYDKQDLTHQHYNQILNTVMNLHMLEQYKGVYRQLPTVHIPDWDEKDSDDRKYLLILDIDETMMHVIDERDGPSMRFQHTIDIPHETVPNQTEQIHLNLRPYLLESLHDLASKFYIMSYTASEQTYADAVLDFIEAQYRKKYLSSNGVLPQTSNAAESTQSIHYAALPGTLFRTRLYRQHCVQTPFGCIKDLKIIDNVSLKRTLIIDNSCLSYALNIDNGVPILPYYDSDQDEELKHLTYYLNCLVDQGVADVTAHNREAFGLMRLRENDETRPDNKVINQDDPNQFKKGEMPQNENNPLSGNENIPVRQLQVERPNTGPESAQETQSRKNLPFKSVDSDGDFQRIQKGGVVGEMGQKFAMESTSNQSVQPVHPQHLASTEYLQCDPIEIKDFQNHFDSINLVGAPAEQAQINDSNQMHQEIAQTNQIQDPISENIGQNRFTNETLLLRDTFQDAPILDEDRKNNVSDYNSGQIDQSSIHMNRNSEDESVPRSMEKIMEKVSEEDECTSFKKRDDRWRN